ncbi:MAG: hypothetical protein EBV07_01290 [Proteobacteria bacterium]|nr:hypothetical protein [Pseudomonadota bacterium]
MNPEKPKDFNYVIDVLETQAHTQNPTLEDLATLVDLRKVVSGLRVSEGTDIDDKEFARVMIPSLIIRTLDSVATDTEETTLKETVLKGRVNLQNKTNELLGRINKRERFSGEEMEQLEKTMMKSYSNVVLNKITDRQILNSLGQIEILMRNIVDLDLVDTK